MFEIWYGDEYITTVNTWKEACEMHERGFSVRDYSK